jgi:hypothetical protein
LLPALALMRTGCASTHRQAGIEHQYPCLCPCREVPGTERGEGEQHQDMCHPCCRPKEERKSGSRERRVRCGRASASTSLRTRSWGE